MGSTAQTNRRELAHRASDGIEVRLLWSRGERLAHVSVLDTPTGDSFAIDVRNGDRPLDVFHHPYAYAAARGIETAASERDKLVTA